MGEPEAREGRASPAGFSCVRGVVGRLADSIPDVAEALVLDVVCVGRELLVWSVSESSVGRRLSVLILLVARRCGSGGAGGPSLRDPRADIPDHVGLRPGQVIAQLPAHELDLEDHLEGLTRTTTAFLPTSHRSHLTAVAGRPGNAAYAIKIAVTLAPHKTAPPPYTRRPRRPDQRRAGRHAQLIKVTFN